MAVKVYAGMLLINQKLWHHASSTVPCHLTYSTLPIPACICAGLKYAKEHTICFLEMHKYDSLVSHWMESQWENALGPDNCSGPSCHSLKSHNLLSALTSPRARKALLTLEASTHHSCVVCLCQTRHAEIYFPLRLVHQLRGEILLSDPSPAAPGAPGLADTQGQVCLRELCSLSDTPI